jgi:hypothetical protein
MKQSEMDQKKEVAAANARNPSSVQTEAKKLMEGLDLGGAKERLERDLTVLITVRETLKVVLDELGDTVKEKANIELAKKLELAGQQLDSLAGNA